jgi:hypothetical protein
MPKNHIDTFVYGAEIHKSGADHDQWIRVRQVIQIKPRVFGGKCRRRNCELRMTWHALRVDAANKLFEPKSFYFRADERARSIRKPLKPSDTTNWFEYTFPKLLLPHPRRRHKPQARNLDPTPFHPAGAAGKTSLTVVPTFTVDSNANVAP